MFGRLYRSSMDMGSRILFAIALVMIVLQVSEALWSVARPGAENGFHGDWLSVATQLFAALSNAVIPLTGALLIDRLDRRLPIGLGGRGTAEGGSHASSTDRPE